MKSPKVKAEAEIARLCQKKRRNGKRKKEEKKQANTYTGTYVFTKRASSFILMLILIQGRPPRPKDLFSPL